MKWSCDILLVRLQKFLSQSGIASRRKSEELIRQGKVKVNGEVVNIMGTKINPQHDEVRVNDKIVKAKEEKIYIIVNKPEGYLSSVSDPFNRPTVLDLVSKDIRKGLYPAGRLDYDSSGLVLLTNDGEFTYKLTHPKYEIPKTYIVTVNGVPNEDMVNKLRRGVKIQDNVTTMPAVVEKSRIINSDAVLKIIIREGKKRQIRKMCEKIGHPVISLTRIKIGELTLGNLPLGEYRFLNDEETQYLKKILSL